MSDLPLVSVIMPVFNGARFIAEGIASILAQSYRPLEVLVVDDGSTDESAEIAESFGGIVRCLRKSNGGPPTARNQGLASAKGDIIAFLDADDLFTPDKFQQQLSRLEDNPHCRIVIGQRQYESYERGPEGLPHSLPGADDHFSLQLGCCMFHRCVFDQVGVFDETLHFSDDWDWFMRARELSVPLLMHRNIVLRQRLHLTNITRNREKNVRANMQIFKRAMDRRRKGGKQAESLPPLASFLEPDPEAITNE